MSIDKELKAADIIADKYLKDMERQITRAYKETLSELKKVFAEIYSKFEKGGKLTYAEMQKYNRYKNMFNELKTEIKNLYDTDKIILNKGLDHAYKAGYYRTAYAIEKEVQAKLSYIGLDTNKIKRTIQNPISGLTLNKTLEKNRNNVIIALNQEITRGLIKGSAYGDIAKTIRNVLENDIVKSVRVAQTEAHRINNTARYDSMSHADDYGVKMVKTWVSTLDNRTRDAHRSLDGKEIGIDEEFISENGGRGLYPGEMGEAADDINCRCAFTITPAGFKPDFRRASGEGVIPQTTYKEWAAEKGFEE